MTSSDHAAHRVVFTPVGVTVTVESGTTVLDAARRAGVDLDSTCGGRGLCGRCQIVPTTGTFPKWNVTTEDGALTPWASTEEDYRGRRPILDGQRLGCAAQVCGDAVVEIPAASQVHQPVVTKSVGRGDLGDVAVDPLVHLHYVELPTAELGAETGGLREQIVASLRTDFGVSPTSVDARVLPLLARAAKEGGNAVTVAVRRGETICAVFPGYVDRPLGVAVDVGSTTVAGHLVDLSNGEVLATAGRMNPQIRFGDDLMSRVSYVMMNPGGDTELTSAIRSGLDELIGELVAQIDADRSDVLDIVLVGNPIMHHVALGIDPTPLGQAPFLLATDGPVTAHADDLDLDAPFAEVHLLPCIAGHVGADTAAAILAEGPHRDDELQLLVDIGTNAEIVFGQRGRLFAASSPTGPAFEGAQISAGMRATAGAIERVRVDPHHLEPRVRVIGADAWSGEPGFADQTARLDVAGVCGSGIIEAIGELYLAGVIDVDGTIRGDLSSTNGGPTDRVFPSGRTYSYRLFGDSDDPNENVNVTQDDVRAIQLAKAALRAGIDLLVERAEVTDPAQIGSVRIAGAFGAHIDPLYAKVLGLVPDTPVDRVRSVGNAAGVGAIRALISSSQREEIAAVAREVTKVETATEARFQELFVDAMGFPHTTVATPNLAHETTLPERRERPAEDRPRRRGGAGRRRAREH